MSKAPDWQGLARRLAHWWWTPRQPSSYVTFRNSGEPVGYGLTAFTAPGVFNIYSQLAPLKTPAEHTEQFYQQTFGVYCAAQSLASYEFDGIALEEWACLLSPPDFLKVVKSQCAGSAPVQWGQMPAGPRTLEEFSELWETHERLRHRYSSRPF